jgi:hypothetical protein
MAATYSKFGGKERCIRGFWENLRERDHLEDPGVKETKILIWIFSKLDGGMNWIDVAHGRDI